MFLATPKAPERVQITDTRLDSITLTWQPAKEDSSSARVTAYVIEKRDVTKTKWTHVARVASHVRRYDVTGLTSGSRYYFRVRTVNKAGTGEAVEYEQPVSFDRKFCKCFQPSPLTHATLPRTSFIRLFFAF